MLYAFLLAFLTPLLAEQPKDLPKKDDIRFPSVVLPMPAPTPVVQPTLTADTLYVFEADIDVIVTTSPKAGLVTIRQKNGPCTILSKFIDGDGTFQEKEFTGKSVFIVKAAGVGQVEILVIPVGAKTEAEIKRRTINVDSGQAPQPPPGPGPSPNPNPGPNPTASKLQIVTFDDFQKRPSDQNTALLLGDVGYWQSVRDAGHRFRSYDLTNPGAAAWKQWWKDSGGAGIPPPLVVFTDSASPYRFLGAERMPANKDGMDALIKKYSGK